VLTRLVTPFAVDPAHHTASVDKRTHSLHSAPTHIQASL
jgi:hypothetical protein